jgi:hypothetical protein
MDVLVFRLTTSICELLDVNVVAHGAEASFEIAGRRLAVARREVG